MKNMNDNLTNENNMNKDNMNKEIPNCDSMDNCFSGMYVYKCDICNQIVTSTCELKNPISCCGKEMKLIHPKTEEDKAEKHVPVYEKEGNTIIVNVGSVPHPMEEAHHIIWISIITNTGVHVKFLNCTGEPKATFKLGENETPRAIYAYCNIHGLWCQKVD